MLMTQNLNVLGCLIFALRHPFSARHDEHCGSLSGLLSYVLLYNLLAIVACIFLLLAPVVPRLSVKVASRVCVSVLRKE
jgi:hypothetical protein